MSDVGHSVSQGVTANLVNAAPTVLAGLVDEDGLAAQLGKTRRTILRWRALGLILPSIQLGAKRYYSVELVHEFLLAKARTSVAIGKSRGRRFEVQAGRRVAAERR